MMSRLFCMLAITLAMATLTWGLVGWAAGRFVIDSLWPLHGTVRLHPIHLIGVGLAILPVALYALLLPDVPASNSAVKPPSES